MFNPITQSFDSIEELRNQAGAPDAVVFILNTDLSKEIVSARWDPNSEEDDDGVSVIKVNDLETGRWIVKQPIDVFQQLSFDEDSSLSISGGNSVSIRNLAPRGLNGADGMVGAEPSKFFPFTFGSNQSGWPFESGCGIQIERRSTSSNRTGFRIFHRSQNQDVLYYQRKVYGDLTTWATPEVIPFLSQLYSREDSNNRFFGTSFNADSSLGGFQSVDLDAVVGTRAFQVESTVNGMPSSLANKNNSVVINLYQSSSVSPQMLFASTGADMDNNFWYRNRQGNTWYQVADRDHINTNYYNKTSADARFLGTGFNEAGDLNSVQSISDLNTLNGARILRIGSGVSNLPTPMQGTNPATVINLYGPSGTDCPQIVMANSGSDVPDNFWYRGTRTSSWSRVASRQWVDTNYYLKTSADARFMGTGFNDSGSLGNWQTVPDLNSVTGARIFRIDSTSLNMPSPMQGVNPSTVINLYGPAGVDSPQMIFAASGEDMNNNFWYRNSQSDTWYQVADRAWTNANFLLQSSVAGSITQTDVDNWNGSIGDPAWSEVTNKPTVIQNIEAGDVGLVSRLSISRPVQQNFAGDVDTVLTTGIGHVFASGSTNLPVEHNGTLYTGYHAGAANGGSTQIFVSTQSSGNMYFRRRHPNGTWYDWHRVLTETNAASIYLPLTGGTLTGDLTATQYKLSSLNTAPSSAADTGTTGEIRVAADYIYVCIATDTWVRAELTSW